jgi:hypothetical protein
MTRDLRRYARDTNVRIIVGALILLFIVGDGLIYWIYGAQAAIFGLLCILGGLLPIVILLLIFWFMDWIVKRANRQ